MTLPPECDFCDRWLEDGEELVPVFIGGPPEPKPMYFQEIIDDLNTSQMFCGKTAGEWLAIKKLFRDNEKVKLKTYDTVEEIQPQTDLSTEYITQFEANRNDDKASAEIRIEPDHRQPTADLQVCEYCAKSLREEP